MAGYNKPPTRANLSPSLLQGYWTKPDGRGKTAEELNARMPVFGSWEEAIAGIPGDDAYKTMILQEAYGLPQNYDVKNGRLVESHPARKGLALGAGMMGGLFGLDALIGGPAAAAGAVGGGASGTGGLLPATAVPGAATLTTGAIAPGMTTGASVAGSAGAAGAAGSLSGAGIGREILNRITSPQGAAALTALMGMLANRGPSGNASGANSAQVTDLMNMTVDRAKRTDPLHQSITQLAMSRLPTSVQK